MDRVQIIVFGAWTVGCLKQAYDVRRLEKAYISSNIDPEFGQLKKSARFNLSRQLEYNKKASRVVFLRDSGHPEVDLLAARVRRDQLFLLCFFVAIFLSMFTDFSLFIARN